MARIVILGAGIGGVPMAFEMKEMVGKKHDVTVISDTPTFHFVPSNPWVPPKWRKPEDLKMDGFRVTLLYGWHPLVEGMRRLKGE